MCGINGVLNFSNQIKPNEQFSILAEMNKSLGHRGPDDSGIWQNDNGLALGHTRLSIIDLSTQGHQPMHSDCGRYTIVFNGEIYNYLLLKKELKQYNYHGYSDTEVILAAFSEWGIEESLRRFNGMFAIAVWDQKLETLTLARDKVGKKPLYYGGIGEYFVFTSELKTLKNIPGFQAEIDRQTLVLFLRYNYIPTPYSIYKGIFKLQAGTSMSLNQSNLQSTLDFEPYIKPYWSALSTAHEQFSKPSQTNETEAVDQLDHLITDSTQMRMISDVPIGILLSGGVDSTTVAGVMQKLSKTPIKSYSLGFENSDKDEAQAAKKIANYLKTDHHELYISGNDALEIVPKIPEIYDEPFADSSQIPTYLISKLASNEIKVALTGDGGDELFYGYNRYFRNTKSWKIQQNIPAIARKIIAKSITSKGRKQGIETRFKKLAADISAEHCLDMYNNRISKWVQPEILVLGGKAILSDKFQDVKSLEINEVENNMMLFDYVQYLSDDILVKVDRASMANSLELRNPLLDYRIAEFAWSLPTTLKYRNSHGKFILRQVLNRYIPKSLTQQPKKGFGSPIKKWLKGPLLEWAEELLNEKRLKEEGIFDAKQVTKIWHDFKTSNQKYHTHLWNILMFQAWYECINIK